MVFRRGFLFFCLAFSIALIKSYASFSLPEQFRLHSDPHKLALKYSIETKSGSIGSIHRKIFCLSYELIDNEGHLISYALHMLDGDLHRFEIRDAEGGLIGFFEEPSYTIVPQFDILSDNGELLAHGKLNFWRTRIYIEEPSYGARVAKLSREFTGTSNPWSALIEIPEYFQSYSIDPRLFVLVMAIQSDAETWRKYDGF